jgi:hypothetical protein
MFKPFVGMSLALSRALAKNKSLLSMVPKFGYHKNVIDHYEEPRNVGSLDRGAKNVGTGTVLHFFSSDFEYEGLVGAPACGDVMKLQIKVGEDGKTIEKAVFKVPHSLTKVNGVTYGYL